MHFTIDGQRYAVAIATRPLITNGQPSRAKIDYGARRIWLSDQLPRHDRRKSLFHELRHAWVDARGRAGDEERDAIDAGEMMDLLFEQYLAEGGDTVLESLDPEAQPSLARKTSGPLTMASRPCGSCQSDVMCGSIVDGPPQWSADAGCWVMDRGMLCDACDRVTVWREVCTAEGMPTGALIAHPKPRVLAGAAAGRWIKEHASDCRVVTATAI